MARVADDVAVDVAVVGGGTAGVAAAVTAAELGARTAFAALHARTTATPLVIWSYPSRAAAALVTMSTAWSSLTA